MQQKHRTSNARRDHAGAERAPRPPSDRYSPSSKRDMSQETNARPHKAVYTVVDGKDDKSYWRQLGVAFVNRDGSINVLLEGLPVNGKLQIRDAEPRGGEAERPDGEDADYPDAGR